MLWDGDRPQIISEIGRRRSQRLSIQIKLTGRGEVEDIATDLNLIGGPVFGDSPTSIFRRLMRLT